MSMGRRCAADGRCWSIFAALIVVAPFVACASRPETGFLASVPAGAPGATDHTVLIATTRARDARPGTFFNGERAPSLSYAEMTVSVPPNHVPGQVEMASTLPGDPNTNYVVRKGEYLDSDKAFVQALNAQLALRPKGNRKVFVFIHGYNTMFAEALYRFTQIIQDAKSPGVPVLFTWASGGKLTDYVYDNNSATAARDGLAHVLRLAFESNADRVDILAHSMGNWVTVEALRQTKIAGGMPNANKFGTVAPAAPDIDLDVFKSQLRSFGTIRKPFYVILSEDDRALWASKFIAGGETRVGDDPNVKELAALGATVIDLTDVKADDPTNHGKFDQLAEVAPEFRAVLARGVGRRGASRQEAITQNVGAVVSAPITLLGAPVSVISGQ
jgi:esterase/lipase superfamily enzyme